VDEWTPLIYGIAQKLPTLLQAGANKAHDVIVLSARRCR
jgi:hypothetical protein